MRGLGRYLLRQTLPAFIQPPGLAPQSMAGEPSSPNHSPSPDWYEIFIKTPWCGYCLCFWHEALRCTFGGASLMQAFCEVSPGHRSSNDGCRRSRSFSSVGIVGWYSRSVYSRCVELARSPEEHSVRNCSRPGRPPAFSRGKQARWCLGRSGPVSRLTVRGKWRLVTWRGARTW